MKDEALAPATQDAVDALRYRWFQACATKPELDAAVDIELVKAGWVAGPAVRGHGRSLSIAHQRTVSPLNADCAGRSAFQ